MDEQIASHPWVLCRGRQQEPKRFRFIETAAGRTLVAQDDPRYTMGWPTKDVFQLDESLLERLRYAYQRRDNPQLLTLWAEATPFP